MRQRGFTLIEVLVVIVMIGIVCITVANIAMGVAVGSSVSWGVNGVTEMRCIDGYKFVLGEKGNITQMLDNEGKGMPCNDLLHRL